ncbi:MAG: hypothetical protein ACXW3U_15210, partial [Rhodoplanes sp.]
TTEQKARLKKLSPQAVKESSLAGEPIIAKLSHASGNNAPIDGLKVIAPSGWCQRRKDFLPLGRSKARPVGRDRRHAKGPHGPHFMSAAK